ncbi:alternative oxidase, mitochondrial [Kwoniella heveanensis BCC8398]|uniref:Alternative oxidase n=1 Tax=Kwoniella heveanensis BCC8398 TaxID=1296120 RepID=A0A1B9H0S3_9TREE|nr:alternative oxidase, mitochondrial [Kwoniella heveanensis BCC8398]
MSTIVRTSLATTSRSALTPTTRLILSRTCTASSFHHLPQPVASSSRNDSRSIHSSRIAWGPQPSAKAQEAGASLALQPGVKQREEAAPAASKVVGAEGTGSEGPHYQDQVQHPHDEPLTGPWTLMSPIYTEAELDTVKVVNRTPVTIGDKAAAGAVKYLRKMFDLLTFYKAEPIPKEILDKKPVPIAELRAKGQLLSNDQWLFRIILLESIAGVPGMVAGTLRHLRSMRLLRRDGGWIHTLLEEAENERMHLLTFMTVAQPGLFTRAIVLAAQGVFYNAFFLTYLISPKTAHRFVGSLEEEAVRTYSHCIEDLEAGLIPEWTDKPAPRIAIDYWRLPADAKFLDVVRAVRADEATHRFVNHSLANLDQAKDFNPFALHEADALTRGTTWGFTREESAKFAKEQHLKMMEEAKQKQIESA